MAYSSYHYTDPTSKYRVTIVFIFITVVVVLGSILLSSNNKEAKARGIPARAVAFPPVVCRPYRGPNDRIPYFFSLRDGAAALIILRLYSSSSVYSRPAPPTTIVPSLAANRFLTAARVYTTVRGTNCTAAVLQCTSDPPARYTS